MKTRWLAICPLRALFARHPHTLSPPLFFPWSTRDLRHLIPAIPFSHQGTAKASAWLRPCSFSLVYHVCCTVHTVVWLVSELPCVILSSDGSMMSAPGSRPSTTRACGVHSGGALAASWPGTSKQTGACMHGATLAQRPVVDVVACGRLLGPAAHCSEQPAPAAAAGRPAGCPPLFAITTTTCGSRSSRQ